MMQSVDRLIRGSQTTRKRPMAAGSLLDRALTPVRKDLEARDLVEEVVWGVIRGKVLELIIQEAEIKEES